MAAPSSLLRGELYKADQMGAIFKLRWVELWAGGKGEWSSYEPQTHSPGHRKAQHAFEAQ